MKYWAKISDLGLVENVTVGDSVEWLTENIGGVWVETFPDGSERGNYAGVGYTYDEALDAFIPPKPFEGTWALDEVTFNWVEVEDEAG
jgi:hypothetical protein